MNDDRALTTKPNQEELDGFAGYEDASEGEEEQLSSSLIVGDKIQFNIAQVWVGPDGEKLPPGLELLVVKVLRVVQKWGPDNKAIADCTRILEPHEKWPDINALNKECPEEWREVFGKSQGPWGGRRLVYLVDQQTMAPYTWPSPKDTKGSRICVNDIVNRINWMRKFKGAHVYPIIELSDTFMNTEHGGRQRPHFIVKRWVAFGPTGELAQLEPTTKTALDQPANESGMKIIDPPTAKEVTGDEIRF